ncbi:hypothetical protein ACEYYH_10700 [Microbacterium trichothecenolyticum]|uniref:hypothetical protein n=1 Tax=Microbacterium trichothecenolyticum TaxID=69370 RepID=UPI0035BE3356
MIRRRPRVRGTHLSARRPLSTRRAVGLHDVIEYAPQSRTWIAHVAAVALVLAGLVELAVGLAVIA